ncbi:FecR family protein [Arenibacter nanhaiticus]|uniref:FecR family protein n=1 Tax=Arenibacter nanhaiticus TaxID=558155 RepID=A0A1M6MCF9_9FLAO|nr:FecR domain-containing protein [Arenibacter nanhaiticus]SHJ81154.1 FecR family protein [Arenibacter nanhaiticus]
MANPEMEPLIIKYLSNTATAKELDLLSDWILLKGNQEVLDVYVKSHLEIMTTINEPDTDRIKDNLLRKIKRDKKIRRLSAVMKYAAVVVMLLSLGYYLQLQVFTKSEGNLEPKDEFITITLENGAIETLSPVENKTVKDANGNIIGTQDKSKLVYSNTSKTEKLVYNTLKVPYGKQFDLILSDGTHVFLNSGTSLRYPVAFVKGRERSVFLTGEAFFEVAEDKEHPFIVNANDMEVKVLGTKFNVSHYPEDPNIQTVLVEGSVSLQLKNSENSHFGPTILAPGHKGEWRKNENGISVENVDTNLYTAWVQGKLVFRNTSFKAIRKALERRYNVTILNKNPALDDQVFDATFDIETIEEVLESFSKSYDIAYIIKNNEVIIK